MAPKPTESPSPPRIGVPATGVILGSMLSGGMGSLSAFVIPVFLDTNVAADHMLRQWVRLYHYGHIYMPAVCVATCGIFAYAFLDKKSSSSSSSKHHQSDPSRSAASRYGLAAVSTIAMVPFTWLVMAPTNNTLFRLESLGSGVTDLALVRTLLVRWAWLHAVRSLSPLLGAFVGFTGLVQELGARGE
ncbi:hypothetical protein VTG60DRAFT_6391 [Thermothelomyces hinnuleus]